MRQISLCFFDYYSYIHDKVYIIYTNQHIIIYVTCYAPICIKLKNLKILHFLSVPVALGKLGIVVFYILLDATNTSFNVVCLMLRDQINIFVPKYLTNHINIFRCSALFDIHNLNKLIRICNINIIINIECSYYLKYRGYLQVL